MKNDRLGLSVRADVGPEADAARREARATPEGLNTFEVPPIASSSAAADGWALIRLDRLRAGRYWAEAIRGG